MERRKKTSLLRTGSPCDQLRSDLGTTARLDPHWQTRPDPNSSRPIHAIHYDESVKPEQQLAAFPINRVWLDRARVFQTAMHQLTPDHGAVDLAINDLTPENTPTGKGELPTTVRISESGVGSRVEEQAERHHNSQGEVEHELAVVTRRNAESAVEAAICGTYLISRSAPYWLHTTVLATHNGLMTKPREAQPCWPTERRPLTKKIALVVGCECNRLFCKRRHVTLTR